MTRPVLAILPGLMCDATMFGDTLAAFEGAQVVEGYYGGATTLVAMADYALERLPPRFALMGHSMGGRVALEVWRKTPERVVALALADTGVHPPQSGERDKRYALRDLGRSAGFPALVEAWLPPMLGNAARGDAGLVARLAAMCGAAGQAVFEAQTEALLTRRDAANLLAGITCPAVAMVGAEDLWSPVDQHEEMARIIPRGQLRVVAGAGHMLPAEAPEAFNAILAELLAL